MSTTRSAAPGPQSQTINAPSASSYHTPSTRQKGISQSNGGVFAPQDESSPWFGDSSDEEDAAPGDLGRSRNRKTPPSPASCRASAGYVTAPQSNSPGSDAGTEYGTAQSVSQKAIERYGPFARPQSPRQWGSPSTAGKTYDSYAIPSAGAPTLDDPDGSSRSGTPTTQPGHSLAQLVPITRYHPLSQDLRSRSNSSTPAYTQQAKTSVVSAAIEASYKLGWEDGKTAASNQYASLSSLQARFGDGFTSN